MARQPINVTEQEGVPGRVDLGPTLGNLYNAAGRYIKDHALGGMLRENAGEDFAREYAKFDIRNPGKNPITPEQREQIAMRTMDMIPGFAATWIGMQSKTGQKLLKQLDELVPGAKKAYENVHKLKERATGGNPLTPYEMEKAAQYATIREAVEQHPEASQILKASGFRPNPEMYDAMMKYVSDSEVQFKTGVAEILRKVRKARLENPNGPIKASEGMYDKFVKGTVLEREYPDYAKKLKVTFDNLPNKGLKGQINLARGEMKMNLNTEKVPTLLSRENKYGHTNAMEEWADNLLSTYIHEGQHGIQRLEDWGGRQFWPNMPAPGGKNTDNIMALLDSVPLHEAEQYGPTFAKMKLMREGGFDPHDIVYRATANEAQAREGQHMFMQNRMANKNQSQRQRNIEKMREINMNRPDAPFWTFEGSNVPNLTDPMIAKAQGWTPEAQIIAPSEGEWGAIHRAAGVNTGNGWNVAAKGREHLDEKLGHLGGLFSYGDLAK